MVTVELNVASLTDAQLARRLGRTEYAVTQWRERNHICATRTAARWITSGEAARITGLSAQRLTTMARGGLIEARRKPGGRWWLFDWTACRAIAGQRTRC